MEARKRRNINTQVEVCSKKIYAASFSVCVAGTKVVTCLQGSKGGEE